MTELAVLCLLVAIGASRASNVELISYEAMVESDGRYHYHYELGDSKATQDGVLKHIDSNHDGEAMEGKFAFIADDGVEYAVSYTADENGYRPVGAHLPTPPPAPASVVKALKYLEEHPYKPSDEQIY